LKDGLGDKASTMIVAEKSYEVTDPTVDSQVVALNGSRADTFADFTGPKFGAQAIPRAYDIGWKPLHLITFAASSIGAVLRPVGLEKAVGLISTTVAKDPTDPQWRDDPALKEYLAWAKRWYPEGDPEVWDNVLGYSSAQLMVEVLIPAPKRLESIVDYLFRKRNGSPHSTQAREKSEDPATNPDGVAARKRDDAA